MYKINLLCIPVLIVVAIQISEVNSGASEENTRITASNSGLGCQEVAVGVVRFDLSYPWLGGMSGWSRGVPKVKNMVGELYVYNHEKKNVLLIATIDAPRRWSADTRFTIYPRILPNKERIFMIRGCPPDNQSCQEARYYRINKKRKPEEMKDWPEVSEEESLGYKKCTAYQTPVDGKQIVSIGPTGGPWQAVIALDNHKLVVIK